MTEMTERRSISGEFSMMDVVVEKIADLKLDIQRMSDRVEQLSERLEQRTRESDRDLMMLKEIVTGKVSECDGKDARLAACEDVCKEVYPWYCEIHRYDMGRACQQIEAACSKVENINLRLGLIAAGAGAVVGGLASILIGKMFG